MLSLGCRRGKSVVVRMQREAKVMTLGSQNDDVREPKLGLERCRDRVCEAL